MSSFFANYGFHSQTNWPVEMESRNPAFRNYVHWMESVQELCVKYLEETREHIGKYYDRSQKEVPPYLVEDVVIVMGVVI